MAFVGALALAARLAFGLGARDTAGEIVRESRTRGQQAAAKRQRAAQAPTGRPPAAGSAARPQAVLNAAHPSAQRTRRGMSAARLSQPLRRDRVADTEIAPATLRR